METNPTSRPGTPDRRQEQAERSRGDPRKSPGDTELALGLGDPRRRVGALGERLAREHLEARGFEVIDANFRTRHGELDLVARDERFLVFCEVKTRVPRGDPGPLGPFAAIGPRKRRRLRLMAREWLGARAVDGPRPPEIRFDAIGVEIDPSGRLVGLEHLEDAF
jgi:putative endonuclease